MVVVTLGQILWTTQQMIADNAEQEHYNSTLAELLASRSAIAEQIMELVVFESDVD